MPNDAPDNPFVDAPDNPFVGERHSSGGVALLTTGKRFINNLLALPSASGDFLATGAAGIRAIPSLVPGGTTPGEAFTESFTEEQQKFPASALRSIPRPEINDIGAAIRSIPSLVPGGEEPGAAFTRNRADLEAIDENIRTNFPTAASVGDIGGDILTLLSGRLPLASSINRAETALTTARALRSTAPGIKRLLERTIKSPGMLRLARGAGRSAEAGVEAMVLDIINGDDPLETAGYAAGTQLAGSAVLEATKGLLSGGPTKAGLKLTIAAAATGSMIQVLKTAVPGGEDNILDSLQVGYDKIVLGLALGAVVGATGGGRLRGRKFAEDLPLLTDAITTLPRAGLISILEKYADAKPAQQSQVDATIQTLASRPDAFSDEIRKRLESSFDDGSFVDVVNQLSTDESFTSALFSQGPPGLDNAEP